jgi:quinoprotein glucose dehydrogenase
MNLRLTKFVFLVALAGAWPSSAKFAGQDWSTFHGDPTASHYSVLDQITRKNVGQLQLAWVYDSSEAPVEEDSDLQCNPLVVDGRLYGVALDGFFFAVDAAIGEELWRYDGYNGATGYRWPGRVRGMAYWRDGEESRLLVGMSHRLQALDPITGEAIKSFGDDGVVDLRVGLERDPESIWFTFTTPGVIYKNLYIVGGMLSDGRGVPPGDIRAYNVRTGELAWSFRTIPAAGEYGAETWPENARETVGAANAWAGFSLDVERGMVFAPTGSAAYDFYGGDRVGQNLFANCVVALKAATGERVWHYQTIHHDMWDMDLPAQPNLVTVQHEGRSVDAVAQVTKTGYLFLLDRETGEPLFPVEEVPVPSSDLEGEEAWPTQPIPSKPPPFTRTHMTQDDITDISPQATAQVALQMKNMRYGEDFIPFGQQTTVIMPGFEGGAEWGGAAYDPQSGTLFINANEIPYTLAMIKLDDSQEMTPFKKGRNEYARRCSSCHAMDRMGGTHMGYTPPLLGLGGRMSEQELATIIREGRGRMEASPWLFRRPGRFESLATFLLDTSTAVNQDEIDNPEEFIYNHTSKSLFSDSQGYPAIKPPWGTLSAIDLNEGVIRWQVPLGEIEELTKRGIAPTGTKNFGGPAVTASGLLFIAASADEKIRAFDQDTGQILWEADLPASGFATPSIYAVNGKQYVVIACGGGKVERPSSDVYAAFALPD